MLVPLKSLYPFLELIFSCDKVWLMRNYFKVLWTTYLQKRKYRKSQPVGFTGTEHSQHCLSTWFRIQNSICIDLDEKIHYKKSIVTLLPLTLPCYFLGIWECQKFWKVTSPQRWISVVKNPMRIQALLWFLTDNFPSYLI